MELEEVIEKALKRGRWVSSDEFIPDCYLNDFTDIICKWLVQRELEGRPVSPCHSCYTITDRHYIGCLRDGI